ncbi:MAG TPA: ferredoxin--NADP reductase [Candidatus Sumerlaeota bacterium]|nr:MAG: Phenol hydroxylase P5 protein [candidate division BRC1 bacterium ADurb.BinA292]HOE96056.1 ferredoxin--NADP reductase [Candidatus Sumerlaeota bacterium]HOR26506.1 ferredoxin--NADP reductase [Candidatus Sumerlaeota bacterium]HPK01851.1 ferredoxin--NADP reductase [Candidatus Sumerlaeota bacterium]
MAKLLEYNATLTDRVDLTPKLSILRVKPDPSWGATAGQIPDFEAGQYVVLGMNNEREPEKGSVQRPYSIASPPEQKEFLEFYIRYVDQPESDNPLTHLLWPLKVGDRLYLGKKITGHFTLAKTLDPNDPRLKVFVAAGTGLAPFVSMILSYVTRGVSPGQFAVLHGASIPQDLGYRDDLRRLFASLPERYMPTISRPAMAPEWEGDVGRVETFFDDEKLEVLEERLGLKPGELEPGRCVVYICGLYGTIHNTLVRLMKRGFVPNDRLIRKELGLLDLEPTLFFEQYDNEPVLDVKNREAMEQLLAETPFAGRLVSNT